MSKPLHTPGPWKWNGRTSLFKIECSGGHVVDSEAYEGSWLSRYNPEEDEANARLIAAAPELLRALIAVRDNLNMGPDLENRDSDRNYAPALMDAALSLATNETPQ